MNPVLSFLVLAATVFTFGGVPRPRAVARGEPTTPLDSARDEMRVGRYWHAARILRELGLDRGDPESTLMRARAEAGWKNWPEVRRVLDGASWLDSADGGAGWFLLGRAREDAEMWAEAADAYAAFLQAAPPDGQNRPVALARLARSADEAGRAKVALQALDALPADLQVVRSWSALELDESASEAGDTAGVVALLARMGDGPSAEAAWRLLPQARLAVGDSSGAEHDYRAVVAVASGSRRGEAMVAAGRLTLARGDTSDARGLLSDALGAAPLSSAGLAAAALIRLGDSDLEATLRLARIVDRAGDGQSALMAYDRAQRLAREAGETLTPGARLSRARLMATVRSRREEAIEEFRAIRDAGPDAAVGARNLQTWASLRRRQGRSGDVRTLEKWLVEEYPSSPQAAEVLWDRGSSAESDGDLTEALEDYAQLIRVAPTLNRAGEARMRTGQIELGRGRAAAAAKVYEAYLDEFPDGRRWEEASFWAARTHLQMGDTAAAQAFVARIRQEEPISYYAVLGARLLGKPYDVDVPAGDPRQVRPAWLEEGLRRFDVLVAAGLDGGADAEEARLLSMAGDSIPVELTLAEELNVRGRTLAGINLGWAIRRRGQPWDRRLLQVVYPFPYRELVSREAAEWGLDPIMLAALIRQESAFKADIRSGAGAVGLMQVMPPTGRELARAFGPDEFDESSLTTPEVNLHLGAAFFVDMNRRYGGDLTLVLSAYNAGPTRATRWRRYPEAADPERFTERIPFAETRGYVKNVRRNLGVYRILYGDQQ